MTAFLLISTGILLLIAVPIGMAMGTASLLTILQGGTLNALIITQKLLSGVSKFSLLAIPMFTLAGEVMTLGGVSDKLIYLANRVVGRFKGGLSMVTTLACMFFGAISGSATATAAAIGGIMVEPMEKAGYKKEYTAAVIASSGLLGLIIPPSGTMLMYAIVADVSVLEMFTGGIIPGIIMGLSLMVVEYFRAKRNGYGTSELDDTLAELAKKYNRYIMPDPDAYNGMFYRSDHFPFVQKGIPAMFAKGWNDNRKQGKEWAKEHIARYWAETYHKPTDQTHPDTDDYSGLLQEVQLFFDLGYKLAQDTGYPKWKPKSEFANVLKR